MLYQDFEGLNIERFDVTLCALETATLPPYLGSTLRGALGHALKDAVCVVEHRDCHRCPLLDTCAYPYLFETPVPHEIKELRGQTHAPLPFIIEPPLVQNPLHRVWRVPASNAVALASIEATAVHAPNASQTKSFESNTFGGGEAIVDNRISIPRRQVSNPVTVASSVVFADGPRRFNIGDELNFGFVLIGRAIDYFPLFLEAIGEMAFRGLGAGRAAFNLKEVSLKGADGERRRVYSNDGHRRSLPAGIGKPLSESISAKLAKQRGGDSETPVRESIDNIAAATLFQLTRSAHVTREAKKHRSLRLLFLTPARIRVKGDLQTDLGFQLLVRSLLRRVSMLTAVHGSGRMDLDYRGLIERAASARVVNSTLHWWDLERYTDRQDTKLRIGGLIGEVEYQGEVIDEFMPLIFAGELLGVGTGTSLGLGRYQVRVRSNTDLSNLP